MATKVKPVAEIVAAIPDGATLAISGSGGGLLEPDGILAAIERRFLDTGHPAELTVVHGLGIGDRKQRGLNRFAHKGMVRRVIGGHWTWSPRMQALARNEEIEAYTLPSGVISLLLREIGAGRPGLITHVGLGTFADPRMGGGACNRTAREALSEIVTFEGRDYIRYKPFNVDFAVVRGSQIDGAGNLSCRYEAADIDAHAVALAAHNCGGQVLAQAAEEVPLGSLPPRLVTVPGVLVDHGAIISDAPQTYLPEFEEALYSEPGPYARSRGDLVGTGPVGLRRVIASRAAAEIDAGASVNFGFGIPGGIPAILAARGMLDGIWVTVEQGLHNGALLDGDLFGASRHPSAILGSTQQFDFYSGGGIDVACLGMGELDGEGNVNVSRLGVDVVGPGGFVDITQNAKKVVFCGTFEAKGATCRIEAGGLRVEQAGQVRKLVEGVREVTFSGAAARRNGQTVLYVTERAVFRLLPDGIELSEIARGIDLQRDVLDRMSFQPRMVRPPAEMDPAHFAGIEGKPNDV